MRHILGHHYFGVDMTVLWDVVQDDLPLLKEKIQALLDHLREDSES